MTASLHANEGLLLLHRDKLPIGLYVIIDIPHSLGLLAYKFAARDKIAGKHFRGRIFSREVIFARGYFREKIFSREDIFAGRYFRVNSIFAKISSRENISN